jgi:hypothetical protein
MRTTPYFDKVVRRRRQNIQLGWIEQVLAMPEERKVQPDGRTRLWGYIAEAKRHLRVVVLQDGTVHNAFFDRGYNPER